MDDNTTLAMIRLFELDQLDYAETVTLFAELLAGKWELPPLYADSAQLLVDHGVLSPTGDVLV